MLSALIQPKYPRVAMGIGKESIVAVSIRKERGGLLSVARSAIVELPDGLLNPRFTDRNIADPGVFLEFLEKAALECGLRNNKKWSFSLPGNSARTAILSVKEMPASGKELEQVLDFKAETSFGVPSDELRVSRRKIGTGRDGRTRYFATAVKLSVADEYESLFDSLGWRAGLILPKPVCEMNWLADKDLAGDSLLISSQSDGFTAVLLTGGEPAVIRSVTCGDDEIDDEIYRLLVYYQDRFADSDNGNGLKRFLVVGKDEVAARLNEISAEALGEHVDCLQPFEVGLDLPAGSPGFSEIAAPAGLAALGWR